MFKKLIITLAAISFSVGALAQGRPTARPLDTKAKETKEQRERREGKTGTQKTTEIDAAGTAQQARSSQKLGLTRETLSEVQSAELKSNLEKLLEQAESADKTFLKDTVAKLLNSAKEGNRAEIEQFLNESFELMKLPGKSGESARTAIKVFRDRLERGESLESAIDSAIEAAFSGQGLTRDQIAEKKRQFKQACLGMKA